jgi:hypothetical protein
VLHDARFPSRHSIQRTTPYDTFSTLPASQAASKTESVISGRYRGISRIKHAKFSPTRADSDSSPHYANPMFHRRTPHLRDTVCLRSTFDQSAQLGLRLLSFFIFVGVLFRTPRSGNSQRLTRPRPVISTALYPRLWDSSQFTKVSG